MFRTGICRVNRGWGINITPIKSKKLQACLRLLTICWIVNTLIVIQPTYAQYQTQKQSVAEQHLVKQGETLWGIAKHFFNDALKWTNLQKINQVEIPKKMRTGKLLALADFNPALIPTTSNYYPALVLSVSGPVWLNINNNLSPLKEGAVVDLNSTIQTDQQGFVTLQLKSGTRAVLPSNSVIKLGERIDETTGAVIPRFQLSKGWIDSYVPKRNDQPERFEIQTPSAVFGVKGTRFRVRYINDSLSILEVLEGGVAVKPVTAQSSSEPNPFTDNLVEANYGLRTEGINAFKAFPLIQAPVLAKPAQLQNSLMTEFTFVQQFTGQKWRVEIARDIGFTNLVREATSDLPYVQLSNLEPGFYYFRASSFDINDIKGKSLVELFYVEGKNYDIEVKNVSSENTEFIWKRAVPTGFNFQLSKQIDFSNLLVNEKIQANSSGLAIGRIASGQYYWRIVPPEAQENGVKNKVDERSGTISIVE